MLARVGGQTLTGEFNFPSNHSGTGNGRRAEGANWIKYDTDTPASGGHGGQPADGLPTRIEFSAGQPSGRAPRRIESIMSRSNRARRLSNGQRQRQRQQTNDNMIGAGAGLRDDKTSPTRWKPQLGEQMIKSADGPDGADDGSPRRARDGHHQETIEEGRKRMSGLDYDLNVLESLVGETMGDYYAGTRWAGQTSGRPPGGPGPAPA